MNKSELITAIAEKTGMTKKNSEKALNAFMEVVTEQLEKEEKVQLVGFGSFYVKERAEKEGRNPQTKEPIIIPSAKVAKFKAGKILKKSVNK